MFFTAANNSANGFCLFPSGLCFNWGFAHVNTSVNTLTFQQPYTQDLYGLSVLPQGSNFDTYANTANLTSATIIPSTAAGGNIFFLAIGM